MGCDCNKERDKFVDRDNLMRSLMRPAYCTHSKSSTANDGDIQTMETIRVLSEPLSNSYRIESFIKEKKRTSMFQANFLPTSQPCSIKFIEKAFGRALIHQKAKLSTEWVRLSQLDHPGVLRTYEVMQDEKYFYVVSESFPGGQLCNYLSDSRFSKEKFAAKIMFQVLRTLAYCHNNGFIHGRLSPKTLVLSDSQFTDNLKVKITGFGELDSIPSENKQGDDAFKAPETKQGFNEKCDIWSCGVILSLIISDEAPFKKPKKSELRRCSTVFSPAVWNSKSEGAVALIASMLQKNPHNRPTAAQCLAHPWIQSHIFQSPVKSTTLNLCMASLRKMQCRNPLQEAILKFVTFRACQEKEIEALTAVFFLFDKDGDGKLSENEVKAILSKTLSVEEAATAARKAIEAAEHNGTCAMMYSDFLICCLTEKKLLSHSNLQKAFSCFDREGRGFVSMDTLKSAFFVRGSTEKERQWRELLLSANRSGDGEINFAAFSALMSNSVRI